MSLAVLLAQFNEVIVYDINSSNVNKINNKKSTIDDTDIKDFLSKKELSLNATIDKQTAYKDANLVLIATPTNYDPYDNRFDTRSVDDAVKDALDSNPDALIVIKSTIPVGHTKSLQKRYETDRIIFSPEFLREGYALMDNLYPSRIIIGSKSRDGKLFANLLVQSAEKKNIETLYVNPTEAEAIKLFSNTYLAMRVSFFNELDSFAMVHNLDIEEIINGVCLDERIGGGYNNPSFGYGGYCLPKDTKQLLANFDQVPQSLIEAIVKSNSLRKDFISDSIIKLNPKVVGIYRLIMKKGSDNFRESAVIQIIERIKSKGIEIVIFEPTCKEPNFLQSKVIKSLSDFKNKSDVIISNRKSKDLNDVLEKVFTRDLFSEN